MISPGKIGVVLQNRVKAAALHAVVAALAHRGIRRDKIDHGQVQADFSGELIKRRKVYPSRFKSCLPDLQFVRNQADYSSESVSRQRAYKRLSLSEEFIGFIEKEILK